MKVTISEFRKNMRKAFIACDRYELVTITRLDKEYILIPAHGFVGIDDNNVGRLIIPKVPITPKSGLYELRTEPNHKKHFWNFR